MTAFVTENVITEETEAEKEIATEEIEVGREIGEKDGAAEVEVEKGDEAEAEIAKMTRNVKIRAK